MKYSRLLAKTSPTNGFNTDSIYLDVHLQDVYIAAKKILSATGCSQLNAAGLSLEEYYSRFEKIVLVSAAIHDIGKANSHFQEMINGSRNIKVHPQGIRHEWVSVYILQVLESWLSPLFASNPEDYQILKWVVAGHHPKFNHPSPPDHAPDGAGTEQVVLLAQDGFRRCLDQVKLLLDLEICSINLKDTALSIIGESNFFTDLHLCFQDWRRTWNAIKGTPVANLIAIAKATLIAADVAGSAIPVAIEGEDRFSWISDAFNDRPKPGDFDALVKIKLGGKTPRDFQNQVAYSRSRVTFVTAGCGSGKTLSAYLWAAKNYPEKRLYFCYPTTGTATEGFRDYLFDEAECIPRLGADLFHGRSAIDFELILNAGPDNSPVSEIDLRLNALKAWKTPIVSCTVDTVLGLVQNSRKGLYSWPALSQSAFVFDEIHSFDDRLFGALLLFIKALPGLPILLMTASLPDFKLRALKEALEEVGESLEMVSGPVDIEKIPRYHRLNLGDSDRTELLNKVKKSEGKILWVTNTVKRAIEVERQHKHFAPIVYHSRFKYEDRVSRHSQLIEKFKTPGFAFAICTQVAEMSLDISADLLVSDMAPIPALIQRLGRLNRKAVKGCATKPFIVNEVEQPLPYTSSEFDSSKKWLALFPQTGGISQKDLIDFWKVETSVEGDLPFLKGAWVNGGPSTDVFELRESSPGVTVLMEEDLSLIDAKLKSVDKLLIPMPPNKEWPAWKRKKGIPIAPKGNISYDSFRGAEWVK